MKLATLLLISLFPLAGVAPTFAKEPAKGQAWVASWAAPISWAYRNVKLQPPGLSPAMKTLFEVLTQSTQIDYALPGDEASDQTFRMIVKPDIWGKTVRIGFSNVFGDRELSLAGATLGLQEDGGRVLPGTNTQITFGGKIDVSIAKGDQLFSDPVRLPFVTEANKPWLRGRNLAVSFVIKGESGPLSAYNGSLVTSYIARPNSGDHTRDDDDVAFPYAVKSFFIVSELDVLAAEDTAVVCALGDSLTDTGTTLNGYDSWPNALSERLHKAYGDKVSVVTMAIVGNTVVTEWEPSAIFAAPEIFGQPAVKRLDRDVLSISNLTSVVWMEGSNDLGLGSKPETVIEGYREVVGRLHAKGIVIVGATMTSHLWPESNRDNSPISHTSRYNTAQFDADRKQLNQFIRTSGIFDRVADVSRVTDDPATGSLYTDFQNGDYEHPNRAGHQAMAAAVDMDVLVLRRKKASR